MGLPKLASIGQILAIICSTLLGGCVVMLDCSWTAASFSLFWAGVASVLGVDIWALFATAELKVSPSDTFFELKTLGVGLFLSFFRFLPTWVFKIFKGCLVALTSSARCWVPCLSTVCTLEFTGVTSSLIPFWAFFMTVTTSTDHTLWWETAPSKCMVKTLATEALFKSWAWSVRFHWHHSV